MGLERQKYQPNRGTMALERHVKPLRLNRKSSLIVVRFAMNEQYRRLDLVGIAERRHLEVNIWCLPVRALLRLESERCERTIVGAAACNAGTKHVAVCEQICGHECTIAVSHDGHALRVDNAECRAGVDRRLRSGDKL